MVFEGLNFNVGALTGLLKVVMWLSIIFIVFLIFAVLGYASRYKHPFLVRDITGEVPIFTVRKFAKVQRKKGGRLYESFAIPEQLGGKREKIQYPPKDAVAILWKRKPAYIVTKYTDALYQYMKTEDVQLSQSKPLYSYLRKDNVIEDDDQIKTQLKVLNQSTLDFVFNETIEDARKVQTGYDKLKETLAIVIPVGLLVISIFGVWWLLRSYQPVLTQINAMVHSLSDVVSNCQYIPSAK